MPDANCKICGGTGWKIVERAGLSGAERCECSYATRNLAIKENSRIPLNYQQAQEVARARWVNHERAAKGAPEQDDGGPYTVRQCLAEYLAFLEKERKSARQARWQRARFRL